MSAETEGCGEPRLPLNFRRLVGTRIYRSGRPELASPEALENLGINTILDLRDRSMSGIASVSGGKNMANLHQIYTPYKMDSRPGAMATQLVQLTQDRQADDKCDSPACTTVARKRHIFSPMMVVKEVVRNAAWYHKMALWFLRLVDILFGLNLVQKYILTVIMGISDDRCLTVLYSFLTEQCGRNICGALMVLTEPKSAPALISCSLGKDRTGILAALVLAICGRSRDQIVADYAASQNFLDTHKDHFCVAEVRKLNPPTSFLTAPSDVMRQLLETMDSRYGSVANYLESIGFGMEKQEMMRRNVMDMSGCT